MKYSDAAHHRYRTQICHLKCLKSDGTPYCSHAVKEQGSYICKQNNDVAVDEFDYCNKHTEMPTKNQLKQYKKNMGYRE